MASTVLPNGIIIPEKYSRDWYADLYHNWQELDNLLGGGTPKDGTLTIQKNGSTVGTFSANQATNETVNIEVPDVNNGTLTIQKNGTDIGTFSANQATDETINIEVPDVNNGTLTIQQNGSTVGTFSANSSSDKTANIQCVDLNSNQTVPGNKEFTGTTTAHDVVPSATDTYNFGSSTAQWNNAYIKSLTINGVAAGDILTHNASEFVGVSGNQTIGGIKTFSDIPIVVNGKTYISKINANRTNGTQAGFSTYNGFKIVCNNDSQAWDNTVFAIHVPEYSPTAATIAFKLFDCIEGSTSYKGFLFRKAGNNSQFSPMASNSTDLGTSTSKWKTFNGINPGALSLPGNYINVDTTNWVLDGSGANSFIPASDGWLGIQATDTVYDQMHYVFIGRTGGSTYYQQNLISPINALWDSKYHGCVFIPVIKNIKYDIRCICSSITATFYPCQGNV